MTITNEELIERIAIAKNATPGPWKFDSDSPDWSEDQGYARSYVCDMHSRIMFTSVDPDTADQMCVTRADAIHIATNDPQDVIAICEELIAAREELAKRKNHTCDDEREELYKVNAVLFASLDAIASWSQLPDRCRHCHEMGNEATQAVRRGRSSS